VPGEDESTDFTYETLFCQRDKGRPCALAFSPKSDVREGHSLMFAVAYEDSVVLCKLDTSQSDCQPDLIEASCHADFINDIVFEPLSGGLFATVSDDFTCCLWSTDTMELSMKIHLSTPGMSVKWHPTDVNKVTDYKLTFFLLYDSNLFLFFTSFVPQLLVAEKSGLIRIFDIDSQTPVQSFECFEYPLISCDWCPVNDIFIGCSTASDLFIWDTSLTSVPIKIFKSSTKMLTSFVFLSEDIVAYRSRQEAAVIVRALTDTSGVAPILDRKLSIGYGLSWNRHHSVLFAGGQSGLHVYKFVIE